MARRRASRQVDDSRHALDPTDGPGFEVEAVLAAARAEIGGLGKGAQRRLARLERKLGAALRVEAKRRRKLGEALGEVAGLVARVREIVRPGEAGVPTVPDATVEEADEKKPRKGRRVKATAATRAATDVGAATASPKPTPGPKPTAGSNPVPKASPRRAAGQKPAASPSPAPKRRADRRRSGPDAGSTS